jgi:hypothetical protein
MLTQENDSAQKEVFSIINNRNILIDTQKQRKKKNRIYK